MVRHTERLRSIDSRPPVRQDEVRSRSLHRVLSLLAFVVVLPWSPALAADASYFGVIKSTHFEQGLTSAPAPLSTNAYMFTAFVVAATNYSVTNSSFSAPNVSTNRSLTLSTNGDSLQFSETFQSQGAMDTAYPSSSSIFAPSVYRFTLGTVNDGIRNGNASYLLSSVPPTPQVLNLPQAQDIDTTRDFQVNWAAMGGLLGIVQLLVVDAGSNIVYSSPAPFSSNALASSSTFGTIPANALPPGANLVGHLVFAQAGLPDTNSYPGAAAVAALARDTAFPLITRPGPMRPVLRILAAGSVPTVVEFSGETNRNYHLQGATNVALSEWVDLLVTNTASASFTDSESLTLPQRYYRVQVGP